MKAIAVGGSLLPYGPKSIFAWLTGFFSVGFARLCFNIIVGLTAVVATNASAGSNAKKLGKPKTAADYI